MGFLLACVAWSLAGAAKAVHALHERTTYRYATWDGGLMQDGKVLTRRGTQAKVVTNTLLALACVLWIAKVLPFDVAKITVLVLFGLAIASDWLHTERPQRA